MKAQKKYIHHVSRKEKKLLKKIYRKCKGNISWRAQIILLALEIFPRYEVWQIAKICERTEHTVYNVIVRYNQYGIIGLLDKPRSGRPRKIEDEIGEQILQDLELKKPNEVGSYLHNKWTLKIISDYIAKNWHISTCQRTISRWLERNDWSFHRGKRELHTPDGIKEREREAVIALLKSLDSNKEVILFLDESAFCLDGLVCGMWMPKGKQKKIYISGSKKKYWIFGVFAPHTKKVYYQISPKCNSFYIISFLQLLRQRFPGKQIHLVLDNASFHHSAQTTAFLSQHPEFVLHFLPARGSRLNPIERFCLFAKGFTVSGAVFADMEQLYHVLRSFFWHYQQHRISYDFHIEKLIEIWQRWPSADGENAVA